MQSMRSAAVRLRVIPLLATAGLVAGHGELRAQAWSEQDRRDLLEHLDESWRDFEEATRALSGEQWTFAAADDRWSISQISEHLALTEDLVLTLLQQLQNLGSPTAPGAEDREARDRMIFGAIRDRSQPVQAPESVRPRDRWSDPQELVRAFRETRRRTIAFIGSTDLDLRAHAAPHPVFGQMDGHQWVLFLTGHCWRHLEQVAEVKADERFPE